MTVAEKTLAMTRARTPPIGASQYKEGSDPMVATGSIDVTFISDT